ncbi:MAG: nucleotidyltransferase domain-containing protein [Candidatus Aminicenantes bacterium]|nr:nucleotidyltransferase domain-containing protein [Candidatus Aminicenantes bacterium]
MEERIELTSKEIEAIKKIISILIKYPEISFAYLHGSFEVHPFRDIDIAAYCSIPENQIFEFELDLTSELEKEIGLPVYFKVINYAPVGFQYSVINEGDIAF